MKKETCAIMRKTISFKRSCEVSIPKRMVVRYFEIFDQKSYKSFYYHFVENSNFYYYFVEFIKLC